MCNGYVQNKLLDCPTNKLLDCHSNELLDCHTNELLDCHTTVEVVGGADASGALNPNLPQLLQRVFAMLIFAVLID